MILTIIFKTNSNGNDYLHLAFLAQNGEGTATNKKLTEWERYRNEIITVLNVSKYWPQYFCFAVSSHWENKCDFTIDVKLGNISDIRQVFNLLEAFHVIFQ